MRPGLSERMVKVGAVMRAVMRAVLCAFIIVEHHAEHTTSRRGWGCRGEAGAATGAMGAAGTMSFSSRPSAGCCEGCITS